jgi:hypothetical protein
LVDYKAVGVDLNRSSSDKNEIHPYVTTAYRIFEVPVSVYSSICPINSNARRWVALAVVTISKVGASGPLPACLLR